MGRTIRLGLDNRGSLSRNGSNLLVFEPERLVPSAQGEALGCERARRKHDPERVVHRPPRERPFQGRSHNRDHLLPRPSAWADRTAFQAENTQTEWPLRPKTATMRKRQQP